MSGRPARAIRKRLARLTAPLVRRGRLPLWLPDHMLRAVARASVENVACSPHHLTRFAMYGALSGRLSPLDGPGRRCLSISKSAKLARILGLKTGGIVDADYPDHSLMALRFGGDEFDACVSDQVLEHLEGDPFEAMKESFRVVRPGGFVVHTTCFINPVHGYPGDFWRYTPEALALLCRNAGGTVIEVGGWGNKTALRLLLLGLRGIRIPLDERHALHKVAVENDPAWPVHTWIVAQKPG